MATLLVRKNPTANQYSNIKTALYDAVDGDIINIGIGTWNENIIVNKAVRLESEAGKASTIIQGHNNDSIKTTTGSFISGSDIITIPGLSTSGLVKGSYIVGETLPIIRGNPSNTVSTSSSYAYFGGYIKQILSSTTVRLDTSTPTFTAFTKTGSGSAINTVLSLNNTSGISVGMGISGTGISAGTTVTSVSTFSIQISIPLLQNVSNATFSFSPLRTNVTITELANYNSPTPATVVIAQPTVLGGGFLLGGLTIKGFQSNPQAKTYLLSSSSIALNPPSPTSSAISFNSGTISNWSISDCIITADGSSAIRAPSNLVAARGTIQNCTINGKTFTGSEPLEVSSLTGSITITATVKAVNMGANTFTVEHPFGPILGPVSSLNNANFNGFASHFSCSGNQTTFILPVGIPFSMSVNQTISLVTSATNFLNVARELINMPNNGSSSTTNLTELTFRQNVISGQTGAVISSTNNKSMFNAAAILNTVGGSISNNTFDGNFGAGSPNSLGVNYALTSVRASNASPSTTISMNRNNVTNNRQNAGFNLSGNIMQMDNITYGDVTQITFSSSLSSVVAGNSFNLQVYAKDVNGMIVENYNGSATFSSSDLAAVLPASGNFINGFLTLPVTLKTVAGGAKTITVTSGGFSGTSSGINVTPAAYSALNSIVSVASNSVNSGTSVQVTLTTKDAYGNSSPTGLPSLSNIIFTSSATSGTGSFGSVTNAGSGIYTCNFTGILQGSVTLGAKISNVDVGISTSVNVIPGAASILQLSSIPSTSIAGSNLNITVTAKDANGNIATGHNALVVLSSNDSAAELPNSSTLDNGVKTFTVQFKTVAGGAKTITVTSGSLTTTSSEVSVTPGVYSLSQSSLSVPSETLQSGYSMEVTLTMKDAYGNTNPTGLPGLEDVVFTSDTSDGTGTFGSVISLGSGVYRANFNGLLQGLVNLGSKVSNSLVFNGTSVVILPGQASYLIIQSQPNLTSSAGSNFGLTVLAKDSAGNTATGYNGPVTVDFQTNNQGATLSGLKTVNAINGVATFSGLSVNKTGTGYNLSVSGSGLTGAVTDSFGVNPGPATSIVINSQPPSLILAQTPFSFVVFIYDDFGNIATGHNGIVAVALNSNSNNATLSGNSTVNVVNGVATFNGLSIDKPGTGYLLTVNGAGITQPIVTNPFDVIVDAVLLTLTQLAQNEPIKANMEKELLKTVSKVSNNPSYLNDSEWLLVSFVFKKQGSSQRFVITFKDFASERSKKLRSGMNSGDILQLQKIIISKYNRSFLSIKRVEIENVALYDFTLK